MSTNRNSSTDRWLTLSVVMDDIDDWAMNELDRLFDSQRGVATSAQILSHLTRRGFETELKTGDLERIWQGIYCRGEPTDELRLRGLDLSCGTSVPVCLGTAAALHGFDTEEPADLHVLSPPGSRLRSADGLVVHRRDGAPLVVVGERPATSPAWTAVEVARSLRRPRMLATLDAALRSGKCSRPELWRAAVEQAGRRGIVAVRDLIPLADGLAESPMESEARLAMLDSGLPIPTCSSSSSTATASCAASISHGPIKRSRSSTTVSTGTAVLTRCAATASAPQHYWTSAGWSSPSCSRT